MGNIIDIDEGRLLVASDIQGNWEDYMKINDLFRQLKRQGKADILVLDGDLVHGYEGYEDRSVQILDDLIDNSDPSVITMLGNHELMNIYHMGQVTKNEQEFVRPLEEQIEHNRERYIGFMKQMPYAIRTSGGVLINHTGANPPMAGFSIPAYQDLVQKGGGFRLMDDLNHDIILEQLKKAAGVETEGQYSPQIGQVFTGTDIGSYLWDVFFNKNEFEYGEEQYHKMLDGFLETMSRGNRPQRFAVTGHIEVPEGHKVVDGRQLRICSSYGANDPNKVLALVDASKQYSSVGPLVSDLVPLTR